MKIVFPDYADLLETDKARIGELGKVTFYDDTQDSEAETIQRIAGAELIGVSWVDITAEVIRNSPQLKYIVALAVGYDQIDVRAAKAAGAQVINCPTHNALAVAEYTIGAMIAVARQILPANRALQVGEWTPVRYLGSELQGKTLGLIGYGTIGKETARLARALGMQVQWATSQTSPSELDALISTADFLSLHLPLTPKTRHLLDERRLNLMKPSAYLINTARGAIADQSALLQLLKANRIAGAALDVFENEPVTGGPNAEILELVRLGTVVATPHIAYNTEETIARLGTELIQNIQSCLAGAPINVVRF
jgi:D-3-phosphoglycerate dehydrogenase